MHLQAALTLLGFVSGLAGLLVFHLASQASLAVSNSTEAGLFTLQASRAWPTMAALASGLTVFYFTSSKTLRPLERITRSAERIAAGDLSQVVPVEGNLEFSFLGRLLNQMVYHWRNTIREISTEHSKVETILTCMTDALIAVDKVGRVTLVNRAAEELLGQPGNAMQGRHLLEVLRHHELETLLQEVLARGERRSSEQRLFPMRSQVFAIGAVPIMDLARVAGAVLVVRDITEIRRLEKLRTEFVANVSHELRTPLTSIKGFIETLLDGAVDDREISRHFLAIISSETDRLTRLINELLLLSRLENNPSPVSQATSTIETVVARVLQVLEPLADRQDITLHPELPPNLPPLVIAQSYLEQVVLNLVENAIKYTPAGGQVIIKTQDQGHFLRVEVLDTGIGILPEHVDRIFERFYRVDKARSRELGGTGLGLAIVKHIVENHGGSVGVRSKFGKGSNFYFRLPSLKKT